MNILSGFGYCKRIDRKVLSLIYPAMSFFFSSFTVVITGRNEVVAKVMFLQVCVCPRGGGVCLTAYWDAIPPPDGEPPQMENPPPGKQTPAYGLRAAGTHPTGISC